MSDHATDPATETFLAHRNLLFTVAYEMLGSAADAEDVLAGISLAPGEEQFELVREGKFPLVGDGGGGWSFVLIADAAEATVAAVEHGGSGVYNIVDDDPAPVAQWLSALARILGAQQPTQALRLAAGEALMTEIRGACNAKAIRELGWRPAHPSWRQGLTAA
jgi:nucleoside-diphosphate-sugar epimerase